MNRLVLNRRFNDCRSISCRVSVRLKINIPKYPCTFTLLTIVCIVGGVTSHSLIPKYQCSFTLLTTVCIFGGVTSHSLLFLNTNVVKELENDLLQIFLSFALSSAFFFPFSALLLIFLTSFHCYSC